MKHQKALLALGCLAGLNSLGFAQTTFKLQVIATGLSQPLQYKANPVEPGIAYVLEKTGRIRLLIKDQLQATNVINLSATVTTSGECGLLGMAFDPNFASNRTVYLHFNFGASWTTSIRSYTMTPNMQSIDLTTARTIIQIAQPFNNHKGGSINFGADGFLYLATGDGGSGNDPGNRAQSPTSLLGKILRINPNGDDFPADLVNNYSIPTTNPWFNSTTVRKEIWAFGMRNPFRWTVDPVSGGLFIADVGQSAWEEINYEPRNTSGRNYGWKLREGFATTGLSGPPFNTTYTNPVFALNRSAAQSITGGFVYRGKTLRRLNDNYLFADYVTNRFWVAPVKGEPMTSPILNVLAGYREVTFVGGLNGVVSIDPDLNGNPIIVEINRSRISRMVP